MGALLALTHPTSIHAVAVAHFLGALQAPRILLVRESDLHDDEHRFCRRAVLIMSTAAQRRPIRGAGQRPSRPDREDRTSEAPGRE